MQKTNKNFKKGVMKKSLPFWMAVAMSSMIFLVGSMGTIQAGCINLADEPLEIHSTGAPGMIMFMYDNSGSMAWSVLTSEDEGYFHVGDEEYGYLYPEEKKNVTGDILETSNSGVDRMRWKSQWSGYNKIYYNPAILYEPWPAWTEIAKIAYKPSCAPQADMNNPMVNVVTYNDTVPLGRTWKEITVDGGTDLDDLINEKGVIVDNNDTLTVQELVADDDKCAPDDPNFTYTGAVSDWAGFCNLTSSGENQYYANDYMNYFGTYANRNTTVTVTWSYNVTTGGDYEVVASIPKNSTRTPNATYKIYRTNSQTATKTISQFNASGEKQEWVSLGIYPFTAGARKVELNYRPAYTGESIGVDAIRLVPKFSTGSPTKNFTFTGPWSLNTVSYTDTRYDDSYYVSNAAGNYTATWSAKNLVGRQNVYVRWTSNDSRSTVVAYKVGNSDVASQNQRLNPGKWMLLKENVSFNQGTGVVTLQDYSSGYSGDSFCADAVAFAPTTAMAGTTLKIVIAHYFVKGNDGNVYLVNLDGEIRYFKFTDDGDDNVENGELAEIDASDAQTVGIYKASYTKERQNFANWFQFARTRNHVAKYALSTLVYSMGNIYFGLTTIPSRDIYSLRAVREAKVINKDDTLLILNNIYNLPDPSGSTPLKDGFVKVGNFFEYTTSSLVNNADKQYFMAGGFSDEESFPYLKQAYGGNCQQAFMIAMTDGWYNSNTATNIGDFDADGEGPWDGGEYADGFGGTLADISMDLYERDMKPDDVLTDDVPTNKYDQNNEQHVVTYALAFGVPGTIDPESDEWVNCPSATGEGQECGEWPEPEDSSPTTIDDLYHSTVNGRGMFLNAGNPQELVAALMKIKENIEERLGSSAAVSTNSVQRQIGSKLYRGEYLTGKWSGDLKAFNIDVDTGDVSTSTPAWSAAQKLDQLTTYASRKIYSFDGSTGIEFAFDKLSDDQKTRLSNGLAYAFGTTADYAFGTIDATDVEELVNYLRGDVSNDQAHGGPFRTRANLMGDIVHSEAEYYNRVLYVGANDGMLHAIHSETGVEQGAYIPNMILGDLPKLAYPQYQHQYFVNNAPSITNTGTKKLLVCPMGKGYKGLFVLDVSAPLGETEASKIGLWEYPGAGATDPDLGYTYSYASIVNTNTGTSDSRWVVITGNGYDSTNGHAILYVFDAFTGNVLTKIDTGVGDCNGLSSPAIIDPDGNGRIDYVYAGDLKGNMWKFDLSGNAVSDWKVAFSDGTNPQPLIKVTGPSGNVQPITNMPGVMFVSKCNPPGSKGFLVVFGTGQYLGIPDLSDTSKQSVYGVYDWSPDWEIKTGEGTDIDKYLGTFGAARTLPNATTAAGKTVTLIQQTVSSTTATVGGETYRFISNNAVNYYNVAVGAVPENGNAMGYYVNLPDSGERMFRRPIIRNNVFMFIANKPEGSVCSSGGSSVFYQLDACSGGWPDLPQFDTNGDGKIDEADLVNDAIPVGKEFDAMLLDITILDGEAYTPAVDDPANTGEDSEIPHEALSERPGARFWQIIE